MVRLIVLAVASISVFLVPVRASQAQSLWERFFGQTPESQKLSLHWVDGLATLMSRVCKDIVKCDVRRSTGSDTLSVWVDNVKIALDSSESTLVAQRASVRASKEGIPFVNGFPQRVVLDISKVSLSQKISEKIASDLSGGNAEAARYIYQFISRSSINVQFTISARKDNLEIFASIVLNDADKLSVRANFPFSELIAKDWVIRKITSGELDRIADAELRGLELVQTIDFNRMVQSPFQSVELDFEERTLLDKVYYKIVSALSSAGEQRIWAELQNELQNPSIELKNNVSSSSLSSAFKLVAFFKDWRNSSHILQIRARDPKGSDILKYKQIPDWSKTDHCNVGAILGLVFEPARVASYPYFYLDAEKTPKFDARRAATEYTQAVEKLSKGSKGWFAACPLVVNIGSNDVIP